jgi:hypothetical protein
LGRNSPWSTLCDTRGLNQRRRILDGHRGRKGKLPGRNYGQRQHGGKNQPAFVHVELLTNDNADVTDVGV